MFPGDGQERVPPALRGVLEWEKTLSHGAGGNVDLCHHVHLDTRVVLKWAITPYGANQDLNARFRRESRALSQVSHPRIVRLLDTGQHDGLRYLVFEFIEGPHLGEYIEGRGPIPWKEAMTIVLDMAEGLAEIHQRGILHRDIKPSNTVVHETRGPVLIDFGLVKSGEDATSLTAANVPLGTPAYVAPEIILGGEVGPAADIYSLGIVLYHLVAGKVPFLRSTVLETLEAHVQEKPPPVAGLPAPVARLLDSCLAKDAADRPKDGAAMVEAGQQVLQEMVHIDETRALDPLALREKARVAALSPDATVKIGVVRLPRPSRIWHGLSHHMGLAGVTLALFLAACFHWRANSREESLDPVRREAEVSAGRLILELKDLAQRGELEVVSRELAYGRPLSSAALRFLEDAKEWLDRNRAPVAAALENRTLPVTMRWEIYDLLSPLEGLERAMPSKGGGADLDVGTLRNRFIVTRITNVKEGETPTDEEIVLAQFMGGSNLLLYPGLDKKTVEKGMHQLATEQRDLQESLHAEVEWSGIPRARRLRISTRCQGPGFAIELELGSARRVRVWGRGSAIDMGNIGNIDGWIAGETPALQAQVLEIALPPDALEPGVHRLAIMARTLAPPIPGRIDCIPNIPWIAIDK